MDNQAPIKVGENWIKFSTRYLGTPTALVWVGGQHPPLDNDDERVKVEREFMKTRYPHIPSGMWIGNPTDSGKPLMEEAIEPLRDEDGDGYYKLDVSRWPSGIYRLNYHSEPGVAGEAGQPLDPTQRDQEVSWPKFWESWDEETKKLARPFIHQELNRENTFCFRILIRPDRTIEGVGILS